MSCTYLKVQSGLIGATLSPEMGLLDDRLSSFGRLVRLDRRGTGASDPLPEGVASPLEQQVGDVFSVMDAVGSPQAVMWGVGAGASVSLVCAATHPERVNAIVAYLGFARWFDADDYPIGWPSNQRDEALRTVRERWGDRERPLNLELFPSRASDPEFAHVWARTQQASSSKQAAVAAYQVAYDSDIRAVLPLVQAPTLVAYPEGEPFFRDAGECQAFSALSMYA
jgi:pimeloyl-ACP methyl ester carboxylesterase